MRVVDIIRSKRDGHALSRDAIEAFIQGITDGSWTDYQASALLMAIVLRGMTAEETSRLTDAMVRSGQRVDLSSIPGIKVGKHSTGGVGDKVSIVLAPVAAACGVIVPKMSGRGLGHTGGTLDKLESIPGFRVALSLDEFIAILRDVGCCLISQTRDVAPADKRLYALRDVTATIESIPLISASVMSKKLSEGSDAVVLDVKCGSGAFMKGRDEALALARSLVSIGESHGVRTEAFITNMDTPLGGAVGNALEIAECIDTLKGAGPPDLVALIVRLGTRMVQLANRANSEAEAEACVRNALESGAALGKFQEMLVRQGGDAGVIDDAGKLPQARSRKYIEAAAAGYITRLDAEAVGRAAVMLGAGRARVDAPIDLAAGVTVLKKPGDAINQGDSVLALHYNEGRQLDEAIRLAESGIDIGDTPPPATPLVLGWVHAQGEMSYV
ncbi:MAG TPA: thymidine phosphorylase [Vicinamibacterales bacterium]|nr:thymidine phosphorylase [Vicinamibacterales bacterium]